MVDLQQQRQLKTQKEQEYQQVVSKLKAVPQYSQEFYRLNEQARNIEQQIRGAKAQINILEGRETVDQRNRRLQSQRLGEALKTGEVTAIDYEKGRATINGQTYKVNQEQLKQIQLSGVKRAEAKKQVLELAKRQAQQSANIVMARFKSDSDKIKQIDKQLGTLNKTLTRQQKLDLYNSELQTTREEQQKTESKPTQKQELRGIISAPNKSKSRIKSIEEVEAEGIEAGNKGKRVEEFIKRGSADFVSTIKGGFSIVKDLSDATFKVGEEQKKATNNLKQIFSLSTLSAMGTSIGSDLQSSNPYEKTRGLLSILPFVGVPLKAKQLKTINSVTKYDITVNPISNSAKTKIKTEGILENGQEFRIDGILRYNPETRSLIGNIKTTTNGKTSTKNVSYKDKGSYFESKTGEKLPKSQLPLKQARLNIKETSINRKGQDITRDYQGQVIVVGERKGAINKNITFLEDNKITQVTKGKEFDLSLARDLKENGLSVLEIQSLNKSLINPNITDLTKQKLQKLSDKGKLQKAVEILKQRYTNNALRKLYNNFEEIKGLKPEIRAKLRASGEIVEINQIKMRANLFETGLLEDLIKINRKTNKGEIKIPNSLTVPKLTLKIKRVRKLKGLPHIFKRELLSALEQAKKQKEKQIPAKKPIQKPKQKVIQKPKQKSKQKVIQKQDTSPLKKSTTKNITKNKIIPKTPSKIVSPKIPIRKIAKIPKIPDLDLKDKDFNNKILTFKGTYRERKFTNRPAGKSNPIITKTINVKDTKNRALKQVADKVDNSLTRSLELRIVGVGKKKKDITEPNNLKKFRVKKSKNTKVLRLVEKSKYALDSKGEKAEAKKQKAIKRKK